jgi:serine/threonine-protein kinase
MAIGTPAYMAPEQLAGDPTADHRIDIYAVGLFAYELLSGHSPFIGATPAAVMAALLTLNPKPISEVRKDVPRRLSEIIMQCLEKDPNDRPPSADTLLVLFDTIATASGEIRTREHRVPTKQIPTVQKEVPALAPTLAVKSKQPAAVREEEEEQPTSRKKMLIPAALILLLLVAAGGYALSRGGGSSNAPNAAREAPANADLAANTGGAAAPGANAPAPAPVMTAADSLAIAQAIQQRLAKEAAKKPGAVAPSADSLKKQVAKAIADSISRAKTQMAATAAAAAAAAAPAPAPAAAPAAPTVAPPTTPAPAGKSRLAIATPAINDQANINTYSKAFTEALRSALADKDALSLVGADGDKDLVITPTFIGTGDTVTVSISVRDLRKNTAGIRVLSAKVMPAYPQYYVDAVVKAVVKVVDQMAR